MELEALQSRQQTPLWPELGQQHRRSDTTDMAVRLTAVPDRAIVAGTAGVGELDVRRPPRTGTQSHV